MRTFSIPTGRRYERKPANTLATLIVRSNGNETERACYVVDISERGVRLKVDAEPTPGQIVLVMFGDRSKSAVRGRVVWAHQSNSGKGWQAGLDLGACGKVAAA